MVKNINVLFAGMLLLLLVCIPNLAWAPWVMTGTYDLDPEYIGNIKSEDILAFSCLDSNDFPHIVWTQGNESGSPSICYLKWNGSSWVDADGSGQESVSIPYSGPVRSSISVCLDSAGHPHIAWDSSIGAYVGDQRFSSSFVSYLWWNGSEWVDADGTGRESQRVGTGFGYSFPSLSLDSSGLPHLLVIRKYPSPLCTPHVCYLRWNGRRWIEIGFPGGKEGPIFEISTKVESLSFRLDSNDQPHMVLSLEEEDRIRIHYFYWKADERTWFRERINYHKQPEYCKNYLMPFLCLDSKNRPHIAFCGETETNSPRHDIHYIWKNGEEWVDADGVGRESEIISNREDCIAPSLCLDSNGYPHIAWFNTNKGLIFYLQWNGNKWVDPDMFAYPRMIALLKEKWDKRQRWSPDFLTNVQQAVGAQEPMSSMRWATESFFLCLDSKDLPHIIWFGNLYEWPIFCAKFVPAEFYCDNYTYHIKGYIKDEGGRPMSGVKVTLSGDICCGAYTTSDDGYYEFIYLLRGDCTVTPQKSGYSFSPEKHKYEIFRSNKDDQNFEMQSLQE